MYHRETFALKIAYQRIHEPSISCWTSCFEVARSMTSSSTVRLGSATVSGDCSRVTSSVLILSESVCCNMAMRVSSGIPGMSFSAMALSRAVETA